MQGCGTAVEHMPRYLVIVGLSPAGCWTFSFFLCITQKSVLNQVPRDSATLLFSKKILSAQEDVKIFYASLDTN